MASAKPIIHGCRENSFSLKHEPVEDFYKSQWPKEPKSLLWVIFRWCAAAFFTVVVPCSIVVHFRNGLWFIYLTDWGFCLCMLSANIGAVLTTMFYCDKAHFSSNSTTLQLYWLIYTISLLLAPVVSIVYWLLLFQGTEHVIDWSNVSAHALNSIIPLTDFVISAMPIRIMHATYAIGFGLIYAAFTIVYHLNGGVNSLGQPYIYPILNWAYPKMSMLCILLISGMFFLNSTLLYFVSKYRASWAQPANPELLSAESQNSQIG